MAENKLFILKKFTILLVDDDEQLLQNLKLTLSVFFGKILTANNGLDALNIYESGQIDMILTDYVMPKVSGYELCSKIRESNKDIPIIIMSNYTEKDKLLKSIPLALSGYLIKPIDYTTLTNTLINIADEILKNKPSTIFINNTTEYSYIKKEIKIENQVLRLTKNETLILELLLKNKHHITSMEQIISVLNKDNHKSEQAIKNLLYRLRQKIGKDIIVNSKGLGYKLQYD